MRKIKNWDAFTSVYEVSGLVNGKPPNHVDRREEIFQKINEIVDCY